MNHPIHRVVAFKIVGPYSIHVQFEDGLERTIDFEPMLALPLFRLPFAAITR